MKNTNDDFEKYLEELTQEIIDAFSVEPDREPSMSWEEFIIRRFQRVL